MGFRIPPARPDMQMQIAFLIFSRSLNLLQLQEGVAGLRYS